MLRAVNLGDDADTTGAIAGQLAGAYYGEAAIPEAWPAPLAKRPLIETYAERLHALATSAGATGGPASRFLAHDGRHGAMLNAG